MLNYFFHTPLTLGIAQSVIAIVLSLSVMVLARNRGVHLEKETMVALARGLVQIVLVGYLLVLAVNGPVVLGGLLIVGMVIAAASTSARRARHVPQAMRISLISIAIGSGLVIGLMCSVGVMDLRMASLVPVGSMVISGAMTTCAQAIERFAAEVQSHSGQIETALALGADPRETVQPYAQAAAVASLIPRIDSIRSLGIVWIPGLMAGMLLSGSHPVYSALYQFVTLAMMYSSSVLTVLMAMRLIQPSVFSEAGQLTYRPSDPVYSTHSR